MSTHVEKYKFTAGCVLVLAAAAAVLISFIYVPYDPVAVDIPGKLQGVSVRHWFGTDNLGRDILSRILTGYRISFALGAAASVFGLVAGGLLGAAGGYTGGLLDEAVGKIIDILMAFPGILIALVLVAVIGPSTATTVLALCIMSVPRFARIARSGFIKYRTSFMVLSSRARGASALRIIFLHIFPNIADDLTVTFTLNFAYAVMNEAGLSYLGLGVQPPAPSFGRMLQEGQGILLHAPWAVLFPAAALILPVIGLTLIGDSITGKKGVQ